MPSLALLSCVISSVGAVCDADCDSCLRVTGPVGSALCGARFYGRPQPRSAQQSGLALAVGGAAGGSARVPEPFWCPCP